MILQKIDTQRLKYYRWGAKGMSKFAAKILKMSLAILGFMGLVLILVNFIMFQQFEGNLKNTTKKCVVKLQKSINGDNLEKLIQEKSKDSAEYKQVLNSMSLAKSKSEARNFYTLFKVNDSKGKFLVDVSVEPSDFLDNYDLSSDMKKAFSGK